MMVVRLQVSEPLGTAEFVHYGLPMRIGRPEHHAHAHEDPARARFYLELDWSHERLVLRDLGTPRGVLVRVADGMQQLRGRELTTASRNIEFAIAGTWMRASIEEHSGGVIAEVAQQAVDELLQSCARAAAGGDRPDWRQVLTALGDGANALRGSVQSSRRRGLAECPDTQDEVVAALMRWAQASVAAVSFIEEALRREGVALEP
jgi:hypothetical protein